MEIDIQIVDKTVERLDNEATTLKEAVRPLKLRKAPNALTYDLLGSPTSEEINMYGISLTHVHMVCHSPLLRDIEALFISGLVDEENAYRNC